MSSLGKPSPHRLIGTSRGSWGHFAGTDGASWAVLGSFGAAHGISRAFHDTSSWNLELRGCPTSVSKHIDGWAPPIGGQPRAVLPQSCCHGSLELLVAGVFVVGAGQGSSFSTRPLGQAPSRSLELLKVFPKKSSRKPRAESGIRLS